MSSASNRSETCILERTSSFAYDDDDDDDGPENRGRLLYKDLVHSPLRSHTPSFTRSIRGQASRVLVPLSDFDPDCCPLTSENLARHTSSLPQTPFRVTSPKSDDIDSESQLAMSSSQTSVYLELPTPDPDLKLRFYGIYFHSREKLPDDIAGFIDNTIQAPCDQCSPNAKRVAEKQNRASWSSKTDGMHLLMNDLLFQESDSEPSRMGIPHLSLSMDVKLEQYYLPPPRAQAFVKEFGPLEQPQPDISFGYRTSLQETSSVFTEMQEFQIGRRIVTMWQHFPFLTVQWRSQRDGDNQYGAFRQSALDGATIINYLHQFYRSAERQAGILDTIHFSLTVDMYTAYLHVHWRQEDEDATRYHMEVLHCAYLAYPDQVSELRGMLRNIMDWAMGPRLENLQRLLRDSNPRKRKASGSLDLVDGSEEGQVPPMTAPPSSTAAMVRLAPPLKRARTGSL